MSAPKPCAGPSPEPSVADERERCARHCEVLAYMLENGAGDYPPGGRLRQAAGNIRRGERAALWAEFKAIDPEGVACARAATTPVEPRGPVKIAEPKRSPVARAASRAVSATPSGPASSGRSDGGSAEDGSADSSRSPKVKP